MIRSSIFLGFELFANPETYIQRPNLPTSSGFFPHQLIVVFFRGVGFRQPGTCTRRVWFQDFRDNLLLQSAGAKKWGVVQVLLWSMFYVFLEFRIMYDLYGKWAIISFLLLERFILRWLIPKCGISFQNRLQHLYIYIPLKYTTSKTGCWTGHLGGNTRLQLAEKAAWKNTAATQRVHGSKLFQHTVLFSLGFQSRQLRAEVAKAGLAVHH